ncbi:carbohydrate (keratan sulfate Gal-6) sulfotransferase 1 isoform 1-like protein [Camelus ferus]|nr:carbohydrate (keratan sulfate Gal-6) sulfotransferase 1 isoform 1-like protein [Camelus ferus]
MQCSWKAVLLLALASIAIQYTAIRTFTAKSFHTCPGLAEAGLAERLCEEGPTFAYNLSRKTHILILATTRSGSSFVGQLFNQHLDVFYLFEPLYHVQNTLIPRFTQGKSPADRRNYIKPPPVNHTTDRIFRRGASRVLCSRPVCDPPGSADLVLEEGDCVRKCGLLNLTVAAEACRERNHVAIKTVIQLVRDPRGILASRSETFRDTYRLWRLWYGTGRKPYNLDVTQLTTGKYMLVRYEDLARNPMKKTEEIYGFLGIPLDSHVARWIQNNTQGDPTLGKHKYGTNACQRVLAQLGYKMATSEEELKNPSISLVEERDFRPFS